MPAPAQPTGFGPEILQPFSIPTSAPTPIQKAPNLNLQFPVFTPPAASSYGTTNPMAVPWTPPDLAGAINAGIKTGAGLATDAFTNKKTMQQISAEEANQKIAIQRQSDPNAAYYTSVERGPQGTTIRQLSPAEVEVQRSQIAQRNAEIARSQAEVEKTYGRTPESQAEIELKRQQAAEAKAKTTSVFGSRTSAGAENVNTASTDRNVSGANPPTSTPSWQPY